MSFRTLRRSAVVACALVAIGVNVGCSALDTRSTIDRLEKERLELLQTKHRLESALASCEGEQLTFQREIERLQGELATANDRIEIAMASARVDAEPRPAIGEVDEGVDAFDELPGVSARRDGGGEIQLTVEQSILFAPGKTTISSEGRQTLSEVARVLAARYPSAPVRVVGHTDNQPIKKSGHPSNWELSCLRSCAVLRELIGMKAVDPTAAAATGLADQQPVAPNATDAGRAQNRRVEIYVRD
ncbi:MAG: OmpA family protein [Planctomycetota bacterium]